VTFNEGIQLDASDIQTGGGGMGRGPQLAVGGGFGGVIVLVLGLLLSGNDGSNPLEDIVNGAGAGAGANAQSSELQSELDSCKRDSSLANSNATCLIAYTGNSVNSVWAKILPEQTGQAYVKPKMSIFHGSVRTGCGAADSSVGPFYCPADHTAYFDPTFFKELVQLGGSNGKLSEEYVVAHEYGHHISNIEGSLSAASRNPKGAKSGGVRTELQADCYAGVWAHWATRIPAPGSDKTLIKAITDEDVKEALQTAQAIGDDSLQKRAGRRVNPESFSHGSAEQRQAWFTEGYRGGQIASCDTFGAADLDNP
jgi:predicted metalloprotease